MAECQSRHRATTTSVSGYLASYMSAGSVGVGTSSCPWYIRVRRGQRLNLTLLNFIAPTLPPPGDSAAQLPVETCYHVGTVRDGPERRHSVTACSNEPRRRNILISTSNVVSFQFAVRGVRINPTHRQASFLIHFNGQNTWLYFHQRSPTQPTAG